MKPPVMPNSRRPPAKALKPHEILLSSNIQNAIGVLAWSKFAGEPDLSELVTDLRKQVQDVTEGKMAPVEAMLYGQAMALQTMFTNLSRRASTQEHLKQFQANLTLALKAQAQCRATLEALAEIKNPRPMAAFVKQANISHGHQQINNAASPGTGTARAGAHAHAEAETAGMQNELLEHQHGSYLDTGPQGKAGRTDPHLEAVGARRRT